MTKNDLANKLKALADSNSRPASARMRDHIKDIEAALAAGARRADVVAALNESGIPITLKNFEQTLYRERRKAAETQRIYRGRATETAQKTEATKPAQAPEQPAKNSTQTLSGNLRSSHDPLADD